MVAALLQRARPQRPLLRNRFHQAKACIMSDSLSLAQIALLSFYAVAMAGGQIMFKLAAVHMPTVGNLTERLFSLAHNAFFLAALVLYGALTVLWVWILTFTPLSRAYVFIALAFAITPLAGGFLFGEPISVRLVVGIGLIVGGLLCVAG
jgi:drug/metabolite transporter (DMT)-like permease